MLSPDHLQRSQSQSRSPNQFKKRSQSLNQNQNQNQKSLKLVPRKSKSNTMTNSFDTIHDDRSSTKAPVVAKVAPSLKDGEEDLTAIYGDLDPFR